MRRLASDQVAPSRCAGVVAVAQIPAGLARHRTRGGESALCVTASVTTVAEPGTSHAHSARRPKSGRT